MDHTSKFQPQYNDKRKALNKSYLVETIIRNRIKDSIFYKQHLYLTNEQTILPVIITHVKFINGLDSNNRPSPFICCLLRLLEINPSNDIINLYLNHTEFKYLICLTLLLIRLTKKSVQVYSILDNYWTNYSKLRVLLPTPEFINGVPVNYTLSYMDKFVDELLRNERVVDLILPRLEKRNRLVDKGLIGERVYHVTSIELLKEAISEQEEGEEAENEEEEEEEEEFVSDSD